MWYKKSSITLLLVLAATVALMAAFACAAKEAEEAAEPEAAAAAKAAEKAPAEEAAGETAAPKKAEEAAPAAKAEEAAEADEAAAAEAAAEGAKERAATVATKREAPEEEETGGEITAANYVPPEQSATTFMTVEWKGVRPTTFQENPKFTEWVSAGVQDNGITSGAIPGTTGGWKMLPLEERLPVPDDILVLQPADEIGVYGGTWRASLSGWLLDLKQWSDGACMKPDADGVDMVAYGCKEWKVSEDGRVWSFRLREGNKWADGEDRDMEDTEFIMNNFNLHPDVFPDGLGEFKDPITGNMFTFAVVDDLWFTLTFDSPFYNFKEDESHFWGSRCTIISFYCPKHRLMQYHPDFQDPDVLAKMIEDEGFDTWVQLWRKHTSLFEFTGAEFPHVGPVYNAEGHGVAPQMRMLANPYWIAVDPVGNQLPYFDGITAINYESREVAVFRSMGGETDSIAQHYELAELPLYMANMEKGDYSIFHQPGAHGADNAYSFSHTYNEDKEIGMAMRTLLFRRAWSTGIDRDGMNEITFLGLGTPQQVVPHPDNRYYPGPEWAPQDIEFDTANSIALLAEAGWTDTDGDGIINRQDPFGTGDTGNLSFTMTITVGGHSGDRNIALSELAVQNLKEASIELEFKEGPLTVAEGTAYLTLGGFIGGDVGTINPWNAYNGVGYGFPSAKRDFRAPLMGLYYETRGEEGMGPTGPDPEFLPLASIGRAPADTMGLMFDNQKLWEKGTQVPQASPERTEWGKQLHRNVNLMKANIGIVGFAGSTMGVHIKRNNFRNLPRSMAPQRIFLYPETQYFEDGKDNLNNPGNKSLKYRSISFLVDDVFARPEVR